LLAEKRSVAGPIPEYHLEAFDTHAVGILAPGAVQYGVGVGGLMQVQPPSNAAGAPLDEHLPTHQHECLSWRSVSRKPDLRCCDVAMMMVEVETTLGKVRQW
jgi:hypothetical protein